MAKKKKSKGSGNPVLDALTEMLSVMSPEEKMQLMANLENIAQSGSLSAACRYWDVLKSCVEVTIPAMAMNITSEDETLLKLLSLPKQN